MPETTVILFKDSDGSVPVKQWLDEIARQDRRAVAKLRARLNMLKSFGPDLRRPHADYLRGGIYELRAEYGNVNYRLLYFFHGKLVAVVAHGLTKESKVPDKDIELSLQRKSQFESDPERFSHEQ